ncbi:MAG: hypothetical protein V1897_08620 [Pseudomonadota bacterium]
MSWQFFLDQTELGTIVECEFNNTQERPFPLQNGMTNIPKGQGECRLHLSIPDVEMRSQLTDRVGHNINWEFRAGPHSSTLRGNGTLLRYDPQSGTALIYC